MARSPILEPPSRVERRAARIADPVERLRFLRREMRRQPHRTHRWRAALLIAGLVAMVAIVPLPTGTAETFAWEKRLVAPAVETTPVAVAARVWLVDKSDSTELYSNGLRIDLTYAV